MIKVVMPVWHRMRNNSIQRALLLSNFVSLLLLAVPLVLLTFFLINARIADQVNSASSQMRREQMEVIKSHVDEAIEYSNYMHRRLEELARNRLKSHVNEAASIANGIVTQFGKKVPPAMLKDMVREALRPIRFENGTGYYFAGDDSGVEQLFPDHPELEGKNIISTLDSTGKPVIRDMIAISRNKGEGFYEYRWTKPGKKGSNYRKLSYVKRFAPFGWFIGAGLYTEDIEQEIKAEVLERIGEVHWPEDGYLFVFGTDGVIQQNRNKSFIGQNLLQLPDPRMAKVYREMIELGRKGGGFVEYVWDKQGNGILVPKVAYSRSDTNWGWIVGSGVYLDDVASKQDALLLRMRGDLVSALTWAGLLIVATLVGSYWYSMRFSRQLIREVQPILDFLNAPVSQHAELNAALLKLSELRAIAGAASDLKQLWLAAQNTLQQREQSQRMLLEFAPYGLIEVLADQTIGYLNPSLTRMLGYTLSDVPDLQTWWEKTCPDPQEREHVLEALRQTGAVNNDTTRADRVFTFTGLDGRQHDMRVINVHLNDDRTVMTLDDITAQRAAQEEIENLAYYDALTGLPNRRLLNDRLQQSLAAGNRTGQFRSLFFIDLDQFKQLNDTQGHDVGDRLLLEVTKRLRRCVRESDTLARLGGDEFVVVLEQLSIEADEAASQARAVADKIIRSISVPCDLNGISYSGSASIGIAMFDGSERSIDELLKRADLAMYQAKANGRNAFAFFDPAMQLRVTRQVALERELRQGIVQNEFSLYYQPQVDREGNCFGVEALLRWEQPVIGMISPRAFIPLAEESGLIIPIGSWVLHEACAQLARWQSDPLTEHLVMAVNVSVRQFRQAKFIDEVKMALSHFEIRPGFLKLEITESLLAENLDDVAQTMSVLRKLGVDFSLDDFGTGYSSLSYLKALPLHQLKIDQSFVRDLTTDPNDAAICRAIIALGKAMGLKIIAEGVETPEQWRTLTQEHCDAGQGYLFGRPMPISALHEWLRERAVR